MKLKHWLVFLLLGAVWSSSFMWIKIAVQEVGPISLVAFRTLFGLLFGIAVILIQRVRLPRRLTAPMLPTKSDAVSHPLPSINWDRWQTSWLRRRRGIEDERVAIEGWKGR